MIMYTHMSDPTGRAQWRLRRRRGDHGISKSCLYIVVLLVYCIFISIFIISIFIISIFVLLY